MIWLKAWSGVLAARMIGYALSFVSLVVLARVLGKEQFGVYVYVITIGTFVALAGSLGLDRVSLRMIPQYLSRDEDDEAKSFARFTLTASTTVSLVLAVFVFAVVFKLQGWSFGPAFFAALLAAVVLGISSVCHQLAVALRHPTMGIAIETIIKPASVIVAIVALVLAVGADLKAGHGLVAFVAGCAVASLAGVVFLSRALPARASKPSSALRKSWIRNGAYFLLIAVFNLVITESDRLMVGWLSALDDIGPYHAAARLAVFVGFGLAVANSIAAPDFASSYERGERAALLAVVRRVRWFSVPIAGAVAVPLLLISGAVLSVFGSGFEDAALVLRVLVLGQLASVLFGPVNYLLTMSGHQTMAVRVMSVAAVINVALNAILIPAYGTLGAAIGSAVTVTLWNGWMYLLVRRWVLA